MWNYIMGECQKELPKFNDYLIYGHRRDKLEKIGDYLDSAFKQSMQFFGNQLTYVGYRELSPEERIEYIVSNPILRGGIPIRKSEVKVLRFEFEYDGMPHFLHVYVPYLFHDRVVYNNTDYFPQFPIVEKGGINRTENGSVIVKVMRVPMTFGLRESDRFKVRSVRGIPYQDLIVTVKIFMGTKGGKKAERIPLILYHLCKYGFPVTMVKYGFEVNDITLVGVAPTDAETANKDPYEYFALKNGLFLKVKKTCMHDMHKRRVVLSLMRIYNENAVFTINDAITSDPGYYKVTLGRYIGAIDSRTNQLLFNNADKHLRMTDPILDSVAKEQFSNIGIQLNDIYDLLFWMFYHIDDLIITYDPTNFYDKKCGSLDQIMSWVVRDIANRQYKIINSKQETLTQKSVSRFVRSASQQATWIGKTQVFRPNPTLYNDNWLLSIGLKRFLSLESIETDSCRNGKKATKVAANLITAHPSHLSVSSVLDIPSSSPIVTGSMNPFAIIDTDGNIIVPPFAAEIAHIYD